MENFLTTFQQLKNSDGEKYDVLYMNTPWNRLSPSQMAKLSIKDLAKENALLFMGADSHNMADCIALVDHFGFTFESVYMICDIASYPPPAPSASKTKSSPKAPESVDPKEESNDGVQSPPSESTATEKKTPTRRAKKPRCPPLSPPKYWTSTDRGTSRGTTEYLLLAYRGDSSVLTTLSNERVGTLPYQIIRRPDLGKKSRSVPKKNVVLDPEWQIDRPEEFMENVLGHLKPGTKILEIFGSTVRDNVDALGPNIPGGFTPCYTSTEGITAALNKVMRSMRKVQLQTLVSSLTKMGQADDRASKVEEFKKLEDPWKVIKKALVDMKGDITYDWSSEDAMLPPEWLRLAVLFFATKNVQGFSENRRKKKKRVPSKGGAPGLHGIARPRRISPELTAFLGLAPGTKISRTSCVKKLNEYVKSRGLQNPARRIEIIPDPPLKKILNPPEGAVITYFKMCSYLSPHYDSKYDVEDGDDVNQDGDKENDGEGPVVEESAAKKARVE